MDPLNAYVEGEGKIFRDWLIDGESLFLFSYLRLRGREKLIKPRWFCFAVADVIDVQEHLGVDEFIDVTVEPLPLSISPTEVYAIHRVLVQDLDDLVRFSVSSTRLANERKLISPPLLHRILPVARSFEDSSRNLEDLLFLRTLLVEIGR